MRCRKGVFALGPTTPGILVPGKAKIGIMPAALFAPGRVAIVSRSGTLSYEFAGILSEAHVGQSAVIGMGADPVVLTNLADILRLFEEDDCTDGVIIVGEVGGEQEEKAARFIAENMSKPVAAYIAGSRSPQGKKMGHAGAIIRGRYRHRGGQEGSLGRSRGRGAREPRTCGRVGESEDRTQVLSADSMRKESSICGA